MTDLDYTIAELEARGREAGRRMIAAHRVEAFALDDAARAACEVMLRHCRLHDGPDHVPTVRMLDVVLAALDVPVERRPLESFDLDTAILQKNQGGLS